MGDRDAWPSHLLRACPAKVWHGVAINLFPIPPGVTVGDAPTPAGGGQKGPFELMNRADRSGVASCDQKGEPIPPVVDSAADLEPPRAGGLAPALATPRNRCAASASTLSVGFWKSAADGQRSGPPLREPLSGISFTSAVRQKWKPRFS